MACGKTNSSMGLIGFFLAMSPSVGPAGFSCHRWGLLERILSAHRGTPWCVVTPCGWVLAPVSATVSALECRGMTAAGAAHEHRSPREQIGRKATTTLLAVYEPTEARTASIVSLHIEFSPSDSMLVKRTLSGVEHRMGISFATAPWPTSNRANHQGYILD